MTEMKIDLDFAKNFLLGHDNFNIFLHASPDGDTVGSGFALCKALRSIGKNANVLCSDDIPKSYSFITDGYEPREFEAETLVSVDVADAKLLGKYEDMGKKIDLSVDHHGLNREFAKHTFVDSSAAANCENILKLLKVMDIKIDSYIAACIYTGISTDTGCFKYSNTSPESHIMAAEMMEYGIDFAEINRIMFDTKTRGRIKIEGRLMEQMKFFFDGKVAIIEVTEQMKEETGVTDDDLEGITSLPRKVEGVLVGVTVREKGDGVFKISVRTHAPIDASLICQKFGGGGHSRAAGCAMEGVTLEQAEQNLVSVIGEFF